MGIEKIWFACIFDIPMMLSNAFLCGVIKTKDCVLNGEKVKLHNFVNVSIALHWIFCRGHSTSVIFLT